MSSVTIYHNPACGTSRNTLALIRNAGIEPTVVEQLVVIDAEVKRVIQKATGPNSKSPAIAGLFDKQVLR